MKFVLLKCDWCGHEERRSGNPEGPVWPARRDVHPKALESKEENKKWQEPQIQELIFCSDKCNQAHKEMGTAAQAAANDAWMTVYKRMSP